VRRQLIGDLTSISLSVTGWWTTQTREGRKGVLYLVLDPDGAAFVLLKPTLELLETAHQRLPSTFFMDFAGSLNRWVRVYDYRDAEERIDLLREWYEVKKIPNSMRSRTLKDVCQSV
jgi:hypothetical protein